MKKIAVAAVLLFVCGSLTAGASTQRYVAFTPLATDGYGIDMSEGHHPHKPLYVAFTRKDTWKFSGKIRREDQPKLEAVDFRRSVVVAVILDYAPQLCVESVTLKRVRVLTDRVDATAVVKQGSNCFWVPENAGTHFYSLGEFPRRFAPKRIRAGSLILRFIGP